MSNHRLSELQRQKQLLLEHLQWLEKEINEASGKPTPHPSTSSVAPKQDTGEVPENKVTPTRQTQQPATAEPTSPETEPEDPEIEKLFSSYRSTPKNQTKSAQTGCLLFTLAIFLILCAIVFAVYWFGYRKTDNDTSKPQAALYQSSPDSTHTFS